MEQDELTDLLDAIQTQPELQLFFNKLFREQDFSNLFFLQKNQLFPTEDGTHLTYLFWNNFGTNNDAIKILSNQAELKTIQTQNDQQVIGDMYTEGLEDPVKDLVMYVVIKYLQKNPTIKELIENSDFNYSLMKQKLQNFKSLDSKIFNDINKISMGAKSDDLDLTKLVLSVLGVFQKGQTELAQNVSEFLPSLATNKPEIFFQLHANYLEHFQNLLKITKLTKEQYSSIIKDLYSQKNIINIHTMFWCANCIDESIILNSESSLHPSHLHLTCPRCSKDMLVSSAYKLEGFLEEAILDKDGLIKVAIAWILDQNDIKFETFQDGEFEYDFICEIPSNNLLIECRHHKVPSDEKNLEEYVKKDLNQLLKHHNKIKEQKQIKHSVFLSNIDVENNLEMIKKIKENFPQELIYGHITSLPNVIQSIQSTNS